MSRFATLPQWVARLILVASAAIAIYSMIAVGGRVSAVPMTSNPMQRDAELYRAIAKRVALGESYYVAAAAEQRERGFPLKPFVTVRPPMLAEATALVGGSAVIGRIFQLVVLMTSIAMMLSLRSAIAQPAVRVAAMVLGCFALVVMAQPELGIWHEAWAATLVALSLALRRPDRWAMSIVVGLAAAVLRELAFPFLAVMAFCAATERHWREAVAWCVSIGLAGILLAIHAHHVAAVVRPGDLVSPTWLGGGGWPFVVSMMAQSSILTVLPIAAVAIAVLLSLVGWIGWDTPFGRRALLWVGGMVVVFMFVGRANNFYWGMMLATILPVGLAFAPRALTDLVRAAW